MNLRTEKATFAGKWIGILSILILTMALSLNVYAGNQGIYSVSTAAAAKKSLKLNQTSLSIRAGSSIKLKAIVKGTDSTVTWRSSDKKIAKVNSNGKVTGMKAGTCTITAKCGTLSASCKITVKKKLTINNFIGDYYNSSKTEEMEIQKDSSGKLFFYHCLLYVNDGVHANGPHSITRWEIGSYTISNNQLKVVSKISPSDTATITFVNSRQIKGTYKSNTVVYYRQ